MPRIGASPSDKFGMTFVGVGIAIDIGSGFWAASIATGDTDPDTDFEVLPEIFGGVQPEGSGLVFEFYVPVEVIPPGFRRTAEADRDMQHCGHPFGLFGPADQAHARFLGSSPSLFVIAFETAGYNVVPGLPAVFYNRGHVIEGQIFRGALPAAILTSVVIPGIDVGPAEFYMLEVFPDFYVLQEPQNAGHLDRETDAVDFAIIFGQHLHFALVEKMQRFFPGDNVDGFEGCVEDKRMFHQ
jgi:hypothetical protein